MRCKKCGFRIRGKNHESGAHHQLRAFSVPDPKTGALKEVNPKDYRG